MPQFLITYRPPRSTFLDDASEEESAAVGRHFVYLESFFKSGKLKMAGRAVDARFGLAIIETESEEEAEAIMENDPAVLAKVFSAELLPFGIALI